MSDDNPAPPNEGLGAFLVIQRTAFVVIQRWRLTASLVIQRWRFPGDTLSR
jgi:hypothetical protein